jgi:hypothetical protein
VTINERDHVPGGDESGTPVKLLITEPGDALNVILLLKMEMTWVTLFQHLYTLNPFY